jgi:hypothetical protein
MADFCPAITGRWSGRLVRVAPVVDRRQESVPGRRPRLGILTMPISCRPSRPIAWSRSLISCGLAATAYLARFKGSSRDHTESDLRCLLAWCAERGLDPHSWTRRSCARGMGRAQRRGSAPLRRCESAPAGPALLKYLHGVPPGAPQFGDPGIDPVDNGLQAPPFTVAGGPACVMSAQGVDDLVQSETHVLQRPGHPDSRHGCFGEHPVARRLAFRCGQHAAPFVEADCVDADACFPGDLPDLHAAP